MTVDGDGVWFGAAVTLSALEETCLELETSHRGHQLAVFRQVREMLRWFAGKLNYTLQFSPTSEQSTSALLKIVNQIINQIII